MAEQVGRVIAFPAHRMRRDMEPWVSKEEVARYLGVSVRWVELRQRDDGLPFRKDGPSRLVRYRLSEVEAWMATRRAS